jgi:hypothetical protein
MRMSKQERYGVERDFAAQLRAGANGQNGEIVDEALERLKETQAFGELADLAWELIGRAFANISPGGFVLGERDRERLIDVIVQDFAAALREPAD